MTDKDPVLDGFTYYCPECGDELFLGICVTQGCDWEK